MSRSNAVQEADGQPVLWGIPVGNQTDEVSAPSIAIANAVIYLTAGGVLKAFDATSGALLYSHADPTVAFSETPIIANGTIYVEARNQEQAYVYAFALGIVFGSA